MSEALSGILGRQAEWARSRDIAFNSSHVCESVETNLFQPLHPETADEFSKGAGDELGTADRPGSMASLRSSAALAVNVFDPWRSRDLSSLSEVLGGEAAADRLRFEATYPTGLRGIPPHLDVVIDGDGTIPLAIESKFTEPYTETRNKFRPSYFGKPEIWDGLLSTRELAVAIADGSARFAYLGAAQLIKHALGLSRAYGPRRFRLLCLWYEWPGEVATIHRRELGLFADVVAADFEFASLTYQELFTMLRVLPEPAPSYVDYLEQRYSS